MPLRVGNLLDDFDAQSFISVADADEYLSFENTPEWDDASPEEKAQQLVGVSRWIASTYPFFPLDARGVIVVGRVAARLAAETMGRPIFGGRDVNDIVTSEKVGSLAITYDTRVRADIDGLQFPWIATALRGLIGNETQSIAVIGISPR